MIRKFLWLYLCLLLYAVFLGCGSGKDSKAAEDAVIRFHRQLDNQEYAAIYDQADPRLRGATKRDDFVALVMAVHNKLGNVASASEQQYFINFTTSGTIVRLTYATKFNGGDAQETFIWSKSDGGVQLVGYNINSNALILK